MGDTYTRQSSSTIVDGTTIEAAHFNNEFDQLVAAFAVSSGHTHDGTAAEGGPVTKLLGNTLTFGAGTASTDITVTFDGESNDGVLKWMEDEDYFEFSDDILIGSNERLNFRDTALYIHSSADGQLDLVADTEIQIAATTVDINGNVDVSGTLTVAGAVDFGDAALSNVGAVQLDSIAGDGDTNTSITFSGSDVITIATGGSGRLTIGDGALSPVTDNQIDLGTSSLEFKDAYFDGTVHADAINFNGTAITSTAAELNILDGVTSTAAELNLVDGITAGTVSASKAVIVDSNKDLTGLRNLTISGDLTVSGDDITMGTNTAGNLLIADGTNFNSVAVGSLSEISTVANDDVFLAVDTSGGGLKKVARSAVVAGLATSSAISNVADDSTPQLGGDLDVNGNGLVSTSNGNIAITPNGTGVVRLDGNVDITSGLIDLKNSGAVSKIKFYCESSNAHAQTLQGAPHAQSASNVLTLPSTGGNVDLVSTASTATLTNKTLTSPKVNEDVAVTSTATELNLLDGVTATTAELNILDGVTSTAAELNILDGVTSTAAELNILDGVTSTATELNIIDGDTSASATTLADADRMVINDNGTMKQVAVTDMTTYINSNASFASKGFATAMAIAL